MIWLVTHSLDIETPIGSFFLESGTGKPPRHVLHWEITQYNEDARMDYAQNGITSKIIPRKPLARNTA